MKMAQPPPDQNFYHHPNAHPHAHAHTHPHAHGHPHPQLQLPPQFRNPFDLLFDERTGAINYNYIRPYIPNQLPKQDDLSDSLVMRRPRRTRTTFTSAQIAELEQHFLQGRYLTTSRLAELSAKLALGTAQVKIWFKNRRRRHKIQSDQQRDLSSSFSCDGMPLSPSVPALKAEAPPNLQALSLGGGAGAGAGGGSGVTTPTTLTPSPTPTTPTATLVDHHYGDSFNPYYYNSHHGAHGPPPPPTHHGHPHAHHQYPPSTAAAAASVAAQFFSPQPHPHQHPHQQQQHAQAQYHHQYEFQHKAQQPGVSIKEEPDFNYNNPYYMRMSSAAAVAAANAAAAVSATSAPGVGDGPTTAMSPQSEVYEPLTPKNDESPSLCNGGVEPADDMDESHRKSLQVLGQNGGSGTDDVCGSRSGIGNGGGNASLMDECTGAFAKYNKISNDVHENSYQCTMDTIMQAYNHRNASSNAQFAYCFN